MAKDAKFDNWVNLFKFKNDWRLNPELPVLAPWRTTSADNTADLDAGAQPVLLLGRHGGQPAPVHRQDPDDARREPRGHQPAGHRRRVSTSRRATSTSASCRSSVRTSRRAATRSTSTRAAQGCDVGAALQPELRGDPEIAKWLTDRDFRRALSLGIDRDQINETFWLGLGTPGSAAPGEARPTSPGRVSTSCCSTLDVEDRPTSCWTRSGWTRRTPRATGCGPTRAAPAHRADHLRRRSCPSPRSPR